MNEAEKLDQERKRALDVYKPSGAVITSQYLERRQEIVGVNKNDLEDILGFDGMAALFGSLGMFLLSGASWLMVDKILDQNVFQITPPIAICAVISFAGLVFLGAGAYVHRKKRGRIDRIFNETKPLDKR
jgi:hypothetical protein